MIQKTLIAAALLLCSLLSAQEYTIVVHGGAGNGIKPENFDSARQAEYHQALQAALQAGADTLDKGATAEATVVTVIQTMETDPHFNAGKGAVLTYEGQPSLDASLMRGSDLAAGAVSGVAHIKSPIAAAREVLFHSPHVLLSGTGAEAFAQSRDLPMVSPDYFLTDRMVKRHQAWLKQQSALPTGDEKFGTVGCAVLDAQGNLAAGTSTGGMMGKRHGRIGDSPIIGAGTYADNRTCALSCTGHGEYFIRYAVAHAISQRMRLLNENGSQAADHLIHQVLAPAGGNGGVIGVTREGEVIMEFNTEGMFRGYIKKGETAQSFLFGE